MNRKLKLAITLLVCIAATACSTTKTPLNRALVHQEKISTVNLKSIEQNITIELSSSGTSAGGAGAGVLGALVGAVVDSSVNSGRKNSFSEIQESTDVMSASMVLKNTLEHNLVGDAFSQELVIDSEYDQSIKKPYLIPILTPSIIMSPNYGVISILLTTQTTQTSLKNEEKQNRYNGSYSSQQLAESSSLSVSKEDNKQYWLDNPVALREKIVNGLYDVAKQFADDFNSLNSPDEEE